MSDIRAQVREWTTAIETKPFSLEDFVDQLHVLEDMEVEAMEYEGRIRDLQATADTMLRFGIADDGAVVDELATALTELKRLQGLQDEWRSRKSLEIPEMKCVQCRHL